MLLILYDVVILLGNDYVVHGNVIAIATIILVGKICILGKYDMIFLKLSAQLSRCNILKLLVATCIYPNCIPGRVVV